MLELKNINKTYISNTKEKVEALSNINLSFDTKGLVFILGSSGSGKSTLLNLIGGIDTPTHGEIYLDSIELKKDNLYLDSYRNSYISFIFQDYNLLTNITVYDNLSLLYDSNSINTKERIKNILDKVGLSSYIDRYPNELSGGEAQRVAIARAIGKDSPIILADEPTGNLNKSNGENICDILKELSLNKLVIVVSHNEELANKYADRIIRIEDGCIIDDSLKESIISENHFIANSNKISKRSIFKLTLSNLFSKKIKFIISMLSIVLAFCILSLSLSIAGYERPYIDYKNIKSNNISRYIISSYDHEDRMYNSIANKIIEYDGIEYIRNGVIESIDELIDMGYVLYPGYKEIDDNSIVVPENLLKPMATANLLKYVTDDQIVDIYDVKKGKYNEYYFDLDEKVYIAGIYQCFDSEDSKWQSLTNDIEHDKAVYDVSAKVIFHTKDSCYKNENNSFRVSNKVGDFAINISNDSLDNKIENDGQLFILDTSKVIDYFDNTCYYQDFEVNPTGNDIYVSLDIYNAFFNEMSSIEYYLGADVMNVGLLRAPTYIDTNINLEIIENSKNKEKILIDVTIKGIIGTDNGQIVLSKELQKKILDFTKNNELIINSSSIKNGYIFLKWLYDEYEYTPDYFLKNKLDRFEYDYDFAKYIGMIVVYSMIILSVLVNTSIVLENIKSKDKDNGVLRAIGIRKKSILLTYLIQDIIMIILSLVLSIFVASLFMTVINHGLIYTATNTVKVLLFRWQYAMIILVLTFITNVIVSYLSLFKAINNNPIDSIKKRE